MCGIFGYISKKELIKEDCTILVNHARQRGRDSSGLLIYSNSEYKIYKADYDIKKLVNETDLSEATAFFGHSRLITNGLVDNQPVYRDDIAVFHNGIIVNEEEAWSNTQRKRMLTIDSEVICALASDGIDEGLTYNQIAEKIFRICTGTISAALVFLKQGKLLLLSNNGSLYIGSKNNVTMYSSERYPLEKCGCSSIRQIFGSEVCDIEKENETIHMSDIRKRTINIIPTLGKNSAEENMLEFRLPNVKRCTKCLLPETMPFIKYDENGVCNYCRNYKPRNSPKPKEELFNLVESYRKSNGAECIVPFSGGRDSSHALHLIVKELKLRAVTYTYDWGMVTDLARRNISRMCSSLGVENIIIAADIEKKRKYIKGNLIAWLKNPNLGMISILTAGDKHFFRYIETVKKQTGIDLNLWGINPLEVTHFKAGFLGVPPYFEEERVYSHGAAKQLRYQSLRFKEMLKSPGYFNTSIWDTLSGEFFRSFHKKKDYFHVYDYWRWDEEEIDDVLINQYNWEIAPDTKTTWRIGDGTAAFYNYIYYTVAGFTEHDTFRSNQIREGQMTREEGLELVNEENKPRYPNIKWYLDAIGLDYSSVIKSINLIPKLYKY